MVSTIILSSTVRVPNHAMSFQAVRSGGPGGQNVNKVASKVELRVDIDQIEGLSDGACQRLRQLVRHHLDAEGLWLVTSSRTRNQLDNLEDAQAKVAVAIQRALVSPKTRIKTRPPKASREKRITSKKRISAIKRLRTHKPD